VGGQGPGPEDDGVDVIEAGFDVEKEGGGLEPESLEGSDLVGESEAGVGGAEARERAALVRVKEALGSGDGRQPDCHHPFKDFGDGFKQNDDAEGGG